ncbi:MAG: hypothetical protein AABX85_01205 [Nanoarchaeota archaeon]
MKREFDRKIWKSGNSYVVTIPSETVERYKLDKKFVTITISDEDSSSDNTTNKVNKINHNNKTIYKDKKANAHEDNENNEKQNHGEDKKEATPKYV